MVNFTHTGWQAKYSKAWMFYNYTDLLCLKPMHEGTVCKEKNMKTSGRDISYVLAVINVINDTKYMTKSMGRFPNR